VLSPIGLLIVIKNVPLTIDIVVSDADGADGNLAMRSVRRTPR
jgi:hypothetical protein